MGAFAIERRNCGRCGAAFDALKIWSEDVPCEKCNRKVYEARLARINDEHAYRVVSIGGAVPTQAEGTFADGRPFYFRARHGEWWLRIGPKDAPPAYHAWADDGEIWAQGEDPSHGWMEDAEVLAILDTYGGAAC